MKCRILVCFWLSSFVMLLWCPVYGRIKLYKLGFFSLSGLRWLFIPVSFLGLDLPFLKVTVTSDGPVIAEDSEMSSDVDLALHSASVALWCLFIPASFLGLDLPSLKVTLTSDESVWKLKVRVVIRCSSSFTFSLSGLMMSVHTSFVSWPWSTFPLRPQWRLMSQSESWRVRVVIRCRSV